MGGERRGGAVLLRILLATGDQWQFREPTFLAPYLPQVITDHDPRDSAARVFAFAKDMLASSKQARAGVKR